jgi:diguanylate cyclase (GGDEF)-like protein
MKLFSDYGFFNMAHSSIAFSDDWKELSTQKLVRYEALFSLLDDIQSTDDLLRIAQCAATQWKYSASVTNWRLVVPNIDSFVVLDSSHGKAKVTEVAELSDWDSYYFEAKYIQCLLADQLTATPALPVQMLSKNLSEVDVLPIFRKGLLMGLLTVTTQHRPFSDIDKKFIRLFGHSFAERISNIMLQKRAMNVLRQKATHDELTGLLNRGTIIERLENYLALSKRTKQSLGLVIIDLDNFKAINDNFGHLAGDEVLQQVSSRFKSQIRDSDAIGRFGGEEFLVVLFPSDQNQIEETAERLRRVISNTPFFLKEMEAEYINVTASLGSVGYNCEEEVSIHTLLKSADKALYQSKNRGRNQVTHSKILSLN